MGRGGTSIEGNPIPVEGGLVLDFCQMNRVLDVRAEDFLVTAEPGVLYTDLNRGAQPEEDRPLLPPGPRCGCEPGGNGGEQRVGHPNGSCDWDTAHFVRKLEVVLAGGRRIEVGTLAAKSSSGYHLPDLFVGSEGTLGVFTKITLALLPLPAEVMTALAAFPDASAATRAVTAVMALGAWPGGL